MSREEEKRYKIGEVCRIAGLQPYVLRYWETEFPPLAPSKSGGGQRLYTQREVDVILRIKGLLYDEGFTIAGAKKKLEEPEVSIAETAGSRRTEAAASPSSGDPDRIRAVRDELKAILQILSK
ncbi:MAG TPA: MerR family transcriptional regulator [Thermoanaerobaculia bacterium]|nr:MerR family transcriptional regulator [Thermoanaerobaculia bacterium]